MDAILKRCSTSTQRVALQELPTLNPPDRLFHYTTMSGLEGITREGSLWASDVRYLNDYSELTYAANLIQDELNALITAIPDDDLREGIRTYPGWANPFEFGFNPFVVCFCEEGDLLSQWRGYGGQTGVSLGFDMRQIFSSPATHSRTHLSKVVYDETSQRRSVRAVGNAWLSALVEMRQEGAAADELVPYPAIWALHEALVTFHLRFKHSGFAEEREWRLIRLVNVRDELALLEDQRQEARFSKLQTRLAEVAGTDIGVYSRAKNLDAEGVPIHFRLGPFGFVPYIKLALRGGPGLFTGKLPLPNVIHGPSEHPQLSMKSLELFLQSVGYGFHTQLTASTIPLRS